MTDENQKKGFKSKAWHFYDTKYKQLLIIPLIILILAIAQIGYQTATTGDFMRKGVSLKGGITITVPTDKIVDIDTFENSLLTGFDKKDISVRTLTKTGTRVGYVIEAEIGIEDQENIDKLYDIIDSNLGITLKDTDYTIEGMGSTLGESFFKETFIAILIAFCFMGIVVFIYFRTLAPSLSVIASVLSDLFVTLAIVNLLGMKIGTAGIAAFLMIIGYSVDTDILVSTKILKEKSGTVIDRIKIAMRTGLTMAASTIAATVTAIVFTQSEVIGQIMTIILIGLIVDLFSTWIQTVALVRMHLDKKTRK